MAQLEHRQQLKQSLMVSWQMQQALRFLQLPKLEMEAVIVQELELNPILELGEEPNEEREEKETSGEEEELNFEVDDFEILKHLDDSLQDHFKESEGVSFRDSKEEEKKNYLEYSIPYQPSFFEQFTQEAKNVFHSNQEKKMVEAIIGNLDKRGFFQESLEEIALLNGFDKKELETTLKKIQTLEPYGIGAKDLQEALLIQLKCVQKEQTLAYQVVSQCFSLLLHNKIPAIKKKLKCSFKALQEALKELGRLSCPTSFDSSQPVDLIPDATIQKEGEKLIVVLDEDLFPTLRLNKKYLRMLQDPNLEEETKCFLHQKLASIRWLFRNVHQRNQTLKKILLVLIEKQKNYLLESTGVLIPLSMKAVAEELELHESTIGRAVAHKWIDTPRGIIPLKSFFSSGYQSKKGKVLSSATAIELLKKLLKEEDKKAPLSDAALSDLMQKRGAPCARRTITKYRRKLQIGSASQRKIFEG